MEMRSLLVGAALVISAIAVQAKPEYLGTLKKTGAKKVSCVTCHASASSFALNPFGKQVKGAKVKGKVTAATFKKIGKLDADKDGKTNAAELKAGTNPGKK